MKNNILSKTLCALCLLYGVSAFTCQLRGAAFETIDSGNTKTYMINACNTCEEGNESVRGVPICQIDPLLSKLNNAATAMQDASQLIESRMSLIRNRCADTPYNTSSFYQGFSLSSRLTETYKVLTRVALNVEISHYENSLQASEVRRTLREALCELRKLLQFVPLHHTYYTSELTMPIHPSGARGRRSRNTRLRHFTCQKLRQGIEAIRHSKQEIETGEETLPTYDSQDIIG